MNDLEIRVIDTLRRKWLLAAEQEEKEARASNNDHEMASQHAGRAEAFSECSKQLREALAAVKNLVDLGVL